MSYHETVLLEETVAALDPQVGGRYLDGTAGGGGHSARVLERILPGGHLTVLDRDPDAIEELRRRFQGRPEVSVCHENFFHAKKLFSDQVFDGILLDLGVSSHQLDAAERGFSYHKDAPLDMRMSKEGITAAELVNELSEDALTQMFHEYAQERFARAIARAIVRARTHDRIRTTTRLAEVIRSGVPAWARREGHPARQVFQALRCACNEEIDGLEAALFDLFGLLAPGGRLAVITFHSLEDAAMKRVAKRVTSGCTCPAEFPVCICGKTALGKVFQKPRIPSEIEQRRNRRSRSAKLRVLSRF